MTVCDASMLHKLRLSDAIIQCDGDKTKRNDLRLTEILITAEKSYEQIILTLQQSLLI